MLPTEVEKNIMKYKNLGVLALCLIGLHGCATMLLSENTGGQLKNTEREVQTVLEDKIISYGVPSANIANYEYSIALAGHKNGYLIKPSDEYSGQKNLFREMMKQVDIGHIAFTNVAFRSDSEIALDSLSRLSIFMNDDKQVKDRLLFIFLKPKQELKSDEQTKLENLGFNCTIIENKQDFLYCKQIVPIQILVTQKAKNTDQLTNLLRKPLELNFYVLKTRNNYNLKKILLAPLYPVAVTYDIITAPITLGALYIYVDVLDKPFLKF